MKSRAIAFTALAALAAATSGCGQKAGETSTTTTNTTEVTRTVATAPACAAGSATLPVTGLCEAQATALLLAAPGPKADTADGCGWTVGEAAMPGGQALLYRALKCKDGTARLAFVAGAKMASFDLEVNPFGGPAGHDTIAQMTDGTDARAAILDLARQFVDDPAERARCQVRAGDNETWPGDALVVDEVPMPEEDGVRSACGPFGYDGGSTTFWRASQGVAWFFQLGQDYPVVDAGSFTLVSRDAAGHWARRG